MPTARIAARVGLTLAVLLTALVSLTGNRPYIPAAPSRAPLVVPAIAPPAMARDWPTLPSPTASIQVFMWWELDVAVRDLDLVREAGFPFVKQKFPWRDIEAIERGARDWFRPDFLVDLVEEKELGLVARLDQQPFWSQPDGGEVPLPNVPPADLTAFGDFCYAIADRYQGRIAAYQVWNEPNLVRDWGSTPDPQHYAALLRECYVNIKAADPAAIVISAGLAPTGTTDPNVAMPHDQFLREMYAAGAQPYFDMLGVHAPGGKAPPEVDPAVVAADPALGGHDWMAFRHVEQMREIMLEYDDPAKQIAILEMGWTTDQVNPDYAWHAVSEVEQAEYLARAYTWAAEHWQPWIGLMSMIFIAGPDWTPEREEFWWAITEPSFPEPTLRPAYYALQAVDLAHLHER